MSSYHIIFDLLSMLPVFLGVSPGLKFAIPFFLFGVPKIEILSGENTVGFMKFYR